MYASRRQIDNLRQAVNLLGFNTAITLALSFSLEPPDNGGYVDKQAYWRRSLASGVAALVSIARGLTEQMRQTDIVARYGGEEFVLVLPGTSEEDAFTLLERLRLADLHHALDHSSVSITVSIGLATLVKGKQPGDDMDSPDDLLRAADRALYAAKREGHNCTVVYQRSDG